MSLPVWTRSVAVARARREADEAEARRTKMLAAGLGSFTIPIPTTRFSHMATPAPVDPGIVAAITAALETYGLTVDAKVSDLLDALAAPAADVAALRTMTRETRERLAFRGVSPLRYVAAQRRTGPSK